MVVPALAGMLGLFAVSFSAYGVAAEGMGVFTVVAVRFVLAASLLAFLARGRFPADRRLVRRHLLLGAVWMLPNVLTVMGGIALGSASLAALILGLEPVTISITALLVAGERPDGATWASLVIGFLGIVVVSGVLDTPLDGLPIIAILLLLGTVVTFSIYTVEVRRLGRGMDAMAVAALSQLGALAVALPLVLIDVARGTVVRDAFGPITVVATAYAGFGTAIAFALFSYVVARRPSARFAVSLYLIPPLGVLAAWGLVDERPHARDVVGGAIILAAVAIAERAAARRPTIGP
jgi:O-acetylserine/cysteine efflux transporter